MVYDNSVNENDRRGKVSCKSEHLLVCLAYFVYTGFHLLLVLWGNLTLLCLIFVCIGMIYRYEFPDWTIKLAKDVWIFILDASEIASCEITKKVYSCTVTRQNMMNEKYTRCYRLNNSNWNQRKLILFSFLTRK